MTDTAPTELAVPVTTTEHADTTPCIAAHEHIATQVHSEGACPVGGSGSALLALGNLRAFARMANATGLANIDTWCATILARLSPGEAETFLEYGVSHRGEMPRSGTWTPNYDIAARDVAWRESVLDDSLRPISVMSRTTTIVSSPWEPAVRPDIEPAAFHNGERA